MTHTSGSSRTPLFTTTLHVVSLGDETWGYVRTVLCSMGGEKRTCLHGDLDFFWKLQSLVEPLLISLSWSTRCCHDVHDLLNAVMIYPMLTWCIWSTQFCQDLPNVVMMYMVYSMLPRSTQCFSWSIQGCHDLSNVVMTYPAPSVSLGVVLKTYIGKWVMFGIYMGK